ncbi:OsmC family protein [Adhaeribacter swui]|uniref:OsmC family protein n=1 Tax=Adhaeribacter swui TaxID=2086471 RepID=A0A7G7G3Z7_9BACT|nr:OsmC family protein [Adhaeribacter swui]QNF31881.1 OsmC family protein [Adhaeribacter swui]
MAFTTGKAVWNGGLKNGNGTVSTESGALNTPYSFRTRFENDPNGTNPEELIGAALAACYSMFLSSLLEQAGSPATAINTSAKVNLGSKDGGPFVTRIDVVTEAEVPGLSDSDFQEHAQKAKKGCPISQALGGVPDITLKASLKSA